MDYKTMNLYTNSMSADELAACLCVKEISSPCISPYTGRYVSLLSEPSLSHRTRQENPFLTPTCQVAKQIVELRPATASIIASRSNSALSYRPRSSSSKKSLNNNNSGDNNSMHCIHKEKNRLSGGRSLTATRLSSRANSNYQIATQTLHPKPASHPKDYSTLKIVSRMPSASDHSLRPSTTITAPYLLAPGGQYVSQLIISRSSSQVNRPSAGSISKMTSRRPTSFSTTTSNSTTSFVSQPLHNLTQPLTTLDNEELDARELELELEIRQIQKERQARAASRASLRSVTRMKEDVMDQPSDYLPNLPIELPTSTGPTKNNALVQNTTEQRGISANGPSIDPLTASITALSRSSSRNVFLESYVAEETVRRCLQRSNIAGAQSLSSCSRDDMLSSQTSVLTAVHLGQSNVCEQNSPQTAAHALKRLISELLQQSPPASPSAKQNIESRSESSSPYSNTYSARDYVTHEDVVSVFDPDNSLNFSRFKSLTKRFYGRISKGKLWSVAKEIDVIEDIDKKIDYLYAFLFNR